MTFWQKFTHHHQRQRVMDKRVFVDGSSRASSVDVQQPASIPDYRRTREWRRWGCKQNVNENNLLCRSRRSPWHQPARWLSRLYSNKAGCLASWLILIPSFLYFLRKMRIRENERVREREKNDGEEEKKRRTTKRIGDRRKSFRLVLSLCLSLSPASQLHRDSKGAEHRWIDWEKDIVLCISQLFRCYSEGERSTQWSPRQVTNAMGEIGRYVGHSSATASSIAAIDPTKKADSVVSLNTVTIDSRVLCLTPWRSFK